MPDPNPFGNITDLEGQEFTGGQLIKIVQMDLLSGTAEYGSAVDPNVAPNAFNTTSDLGQIHVISDAFVPGHGGEPGTYTQYHFATFGAIQFENVVDGDGNPITYYVHGFGTNGLFLSSSPDAGWASDGSGLPENGYILGFYGLAESGVPPVTSVGAFGDVFDKDPTVLETTLCFAEGCRIDTPSGPVAVEALAVGDLVTTESGVQRPVKWIGQMMSRPRLHPRPWEINPVRVSAHAFGPNVPMRDLRLSPGHAVYVDGVLVPVGLLVNGATIVQEAPGPVRYFHIELDSHDVLLAEGLPCESFFDDGQRATFTNADVVNGLYGRLDPQSWDDACAPMVAEGPQLVAIRERLHAQAEQLGWVKCEDAGLTIEADGVSIAPLHLSGNRYWFAVPAAEKLLLDSNRGVLAQIIPGLTDQRALGVAVSELRVDGVEVDLDAVVFGHGFYPVERQDGHGWRWTDGAAALDIGGGAAIVEVKLIMVAPSWARSLVDLRVVA
jgi:hypothetical protein